MSFESTRFMGHGRLGASSAPPVPDVPVPVPLPVKRKATGEVLPQCSSDGGPSSNTVQNGHLSQHVGDYDEFETCMSSACDASQFPDPSQSFEYPYGCPLPNPSLIDTSGRAKVGRADPTYIRLRDLELKSSTPHIPKEDPGTIELLGTCFFSDAATQNAGSSDEDPILHEGFACPKSPSSDQMHARHTTEALSVNSRSTIRKRNALIKDWFRDHASSPYATEDQIADLAAETGKSNHQVRVCLNNLRARKKTSSGVVLGLRPPPMSKNSECMPSSVDQRNIADFDLEPWLSASLSQRKPSYGLESLPFPEMSSLTSQTAAFEFPPPSNGPQALDLPTMGVKPSKRKGKRSYPSRYRSVEVDPASTSASERSTDGVNESPKAYPCTVCPKSFKDVYGWKRHEAGVHGFHVTEWVCMFDGMLLHGVKCAFCLEEVPDRDHFDQHNVTICLNKNGVDRTFGRKDLLKQHVRQVHLSTAEDAIKKTFQVPDSWIKYVDAAKSIPASLWCGFCQVYLDSTDVRMKHVADHFDDGLTMSLWQPHYV